MSSRYAHRKRPSALRFSTDSTLAPLPLYTTTLLSDIPSDRPPDYPDSAEEADIDLDTDSDESVSYRAPHQSVSPRRRTPRSPPRPKRTRTNSADHHLDSLLERSIHALEMSNVLLQSSIATQSTLNTVLASENGQTESALETHARNISSRILHNTACLDDLDVISRGVDSLLLDIPSQEETTSRSLPSSSALPRRAHVRKPSLDLRSNSLSYSNHDRNNLIAPPPRAITLYVDSTESPTSISLSSTLGLRSSSRIPVPVSSSSPRRPLLLQSQSDLSFDGSRRAVDVLTSCIASSSSNISLSPSSSLRTARRSRSGSNSTATSTQRTPRMGPSRSRSPSHSPARSLPVRRNTRGERDWDTPPIIELPSSASESSDDHDMEADRTVSCLRTILQNHPAKEPSKQVEAEKQKRPTFLTPSGVAPIADTSHATASVSRLLTKARHTHSTRPPSPPRHSALKGSVNSHRRDRESFSTPPTPVSPVPSLSGSWLSVSDALSFRASGSSGRSTPNRVSFAELPPDTGHKDKSRSRRSRSRSKKSRKGKDGTKSDSSDGDGPWWTWLLGVNMVNSPSGVPSYIRNEERAVRGAGWAPKPGLGGSIEEWGV